MNSRERKNGNGIMNTKTFKELKDKIIIQPVIVLPKRDEKFRVETNTSGYAVRGVLSQEQEEK